VNPYLIVTFLGGWRATIFLALAVALGATVMVQSHRLEAAQAEIVERDTEISGFKAAIATYQGAQTTNLATIKELRAANEAWATAADARTNRANQAIAAVAAERDALAAELDESRRARKGIYENDPTAAAWGRARVPDSVAGSLRGKQARR